MERAFRQVEVFAENPYSGNPVAVIINAQGLATEEMQAIARWTNLSETTFVLPPTHTDADYRVRIFTPGAEIPFAGHPTLGTAHAMLESGLQPRNPGQLVQECQKGNVRLRTEEDRLYFALPEPDVIEIDGEMQENAAASLRIAQTDILCGARIDVGPVWLTLQLGSADEIIHLSPDMGRIAKLSGLTGITVFGAHPDGKFEIRSFAPAFGVPEDPVCGSGNGCVAALVRRKQLSPASGYTALQGRCLGRAGRVEIIYDDAIWVGGHAATCITGTIKS